MALWIDVKYAGEISSRLELFKVKTTKPYTANFRCPICGDSKKHRFKARGYLFTKNNQLVYKCHNCGAGMMFGKLLKHLDATIFKHYQFERFREGDDITQRTGNTCPKPPFEFTPPVFETPSSLLDSLLDRVDKLPDDHIAVQYCVGRKIPRERFSDLYYVDNMQKIENLSQNTRDKIVGEEQRLVIPCYNRQGRLVGVTCRAFDDNPKRYLTAKVIDDEPWLFFVDKIDTGKPIFCVEGPLDALFLPNCVAVGNSDLKVISHYLPKVNTTLVFDNQPRNKEIVKLMRRACTQGFRVCVWPSTIKEKDVNEMIVAGRSREEIVTCINNNTYSEAALLLNINQWSKVDGAA